MRVFIKLNWCVGAWYKFVVHIFNKDYHYKYWFFNKYFIFILVKEDNIYGLLILAYTNEQNCKAFKTGCRNCKQQTC